MSDEQYYTVEAEEDGFHAWANGGQQWLFYRVYDNVLGGGVFPVSGINEAINQLVADANLGRAVRTGQPVAGVAFSRDLADPNSPTVMVVSEVATEGGDA